MSGYEYTEENHQETLRSMQVPCREFEPINVQFETTSEQTKMVESLRFGQSRKEFILQCFEEGLKIRRLRNMAVLLGKDDELVSMLVSKYAEYMAALVSAGKINVYDDNGNIIMKASGD